MPKFMIETEFRTAEGRLSTESMFVTGPEAKVESRIQELKNVERIEAIHVYELKSAIVKTVGWTPLSFPTH